MEIRVQGGGIHARASRREGDANARTIRGKSFSGEVMILFSERSCLGDGISSVSCTLILECFRFATETRRPLQVCCQAKYCEPGVTVAPAVDFALFGSSVGASCGPCARRSDKVFVFPRIRMRILSLRFRWFECAKGSTLVQEYRCLDHGRSRFAGADRAFCDMR